MRGSIGGERGKAKQAGRLARSVVVVGSEKQGGGRVGLGGGRAGCRGAIEWVCVWG